MSFAAAWLTAAWIVAKQPCEPFGFTQSVLAAAEESPKRQVKHRASTTLARGEMVLKVERIIFLRKEISLGATSGNRRTTLSGSGDVIPDRQLMKTRRRAAPTIGYKHDSVNNFKFFWPVSNVGQRL